MGEAAGSVPQRRLRFLEARSGPARDDPLAGLPGRQGWHRQRHIRRQAAGRPTCVAVNPWFRLLPLRVLSELAEVECHTWLVSDDFSVMAWRDREDVAGTGLALRPVIHVHLHATGDDVAEVRYLAGVGAGDRLDVRRPTPARLECGAPDGPAGELDDIRFSLALERASLVW